MHSHLTDLASRLWAMEPKALESLFAKLQTLSPGAIQTWADSDTASSPAAFFFGDSPKKKPELQVSGDVATVRITGPLMRQVPWIFSFFGIEASSYDYIREDLAEALDRRDVKVIRLLVSSPGGEVAGVEEVAAAIRAAKAVKRVEAVVEDLCASAAYWLASQAGEISAGPNDQIGSIGVYQALLDSSQAAAEAGLKVVVVASGPFKGTGLRGTPITEEQLAPVRDIVDGLASNFIGAVAGGRGRSVDQVKQWATGQLWLASTAKELGLIDRVGSSKATNGAGGVRLAADTVSEKERDMPDEKAIEAAAKQGREEAQAVERKRIQDLNAAFGAKDPAFAMKAVAEGWTLEKAKGEYADVIEKKYEESEKARQVAERALKPAAGAEPVRVAGSPEPGEKDFMELAKAHKKEAGCTMTEAMRHVAVTQPDVHKAFIQRTAEPARQRRKALGIG